jgi:hypothetical protein
MLRQSDNRGRFGGASGSKRRRFRGRFGGALAPKRRRFSPPPPTPPHTQPTEKEALMPDIAGTTRAQTLFFRSFRTSPTSPAPA